MGAVGLQLAQQQGDFLLVGLHADEDISEQRGRHLPLMDLHERSLSVLACKYVDEVVIGARLPSNVTVGQCWMLSLGGGVILYDCMHA